MVLRLCFFLGLLLMGSAHATAQMRDNRKAGEIIRKAEVYLKALNDSVDNDSLAAMQLVKAGHYCYDIGLPTRAMISVCAALPDLMKRLGDAADLLIADLNAPVVDDKTIARWEEHDVRIRKMRENIAGCYLLIAESLAFYKQEDNDTGVFYADALSEYKELSADNGDALPGYVSALVKAGRFYLNREKADKAEEMFLAAIRVGGANNVLPPDELYELKGWLLTACLKQQKKRKARGIANELGQTDPFSQSAPVLYGLAQMSLSDKNYGLASSYIEQVMKGNAASQLSDLSKLFGSHAWRDFLYAFGYMAQLCEQNGQPQEALAIYRRMQEAVCNTLGTYAPYFLSADRSLLWTIMETWFEDVQAFAYRHRSETGMKEFLSDNIQLMKSLIPVSSSQLSNRIDVRKDKYARECAGKLEELASQDLPYFIDFTQSNLVLPRIKADIQIMGWSQELMRYLRSENGDQKVGNWQQIASSLDDGEVAVEFVALKLPAVKEKTYGALIYKKGATPQWVTLCGEEQLKEILNNPELRSSELPGSVWKPLKPFVDGAATIYLLPTGLLNAVSFAGLREEGTSLCEKYQFRYLLSAGDISGVKKQDAQQQLKKIKGPERKDIVLFGAAEFGLPNKEFVKTVRGQGFAYLPGSKHEMEAIAGSLSADWNVRLFSGAEATEAVFKSVCSLDSGTIPSVIHVSTHGFYLPYSEKAKSDGHGIDEYGESGYFDPMLRSGFLLSGANAEWKPGAGLMNHNDGILTAFEIQQLYLDKLELVVISACNTGVGDIHDGEGVFGLQRAFRSAGAASMLLSLWEVPDMETAELMENFYRLWQTGLTKYQAFMQAQRILAGKYPGDPRKWAGFILME